MRIPTLTGTLSVLAGTFFLLLWASDAPGAPGKWRKLAASPKSTSLKPRKVLFLGDSMSMGAFGTTLDQAMRDSGLEVYTFVTGGATPYYWLSDYQPISSTIGHWMRTPDAEKRTSMIKSVPKVESLIKTYDPDIVVVQTGTNMYASLRSKRRSEEANEKEVAYVYEKMCERVTEGGRRCYWITPPSAHPDRYPEDLQKRMGEIIQNTVSKYGRVFNSYAVTKFTDPFPQTDGIHYGSEDAKPWAELVAKDFIAFATDGDGIGRKALVVDEPTEKRKSPRSQAPGPPIASTQERANPKAGEALSNDPISVRMKLIAKSTITDINEVTYKRAWAIDEYEVISVDRGSYPFKTVRLAEFIVENRKIVSSVQNRPLGAFRNLDVVPLSKYPGLNQLEVVDDLPINFDLPILTPSID
ncbi:MAG: hypothetical protein KDN22_19260 [Verrucomicrobiae bacterium]|nr:hypothetical protein [Verrucomicrobiae bacterium]